MKRSIHILFAVIGSTLFYRANAQDFENLRTTTPPSSIVLGYEPTNIDRPSTPQVVATAFQTAFDNQGRLKPNFNIEFAPFWLIDRKNYDIEQYLKEDNLGIKIYRSISGSFSTSQSDTVKYGNYKPGLGLAGGLRFLLLDFQTEKSKRDVRDVLEDNFYVPTTLAMTGQNAASVIDNLIQRNPLYTAEPDSLARLKQIEIEVSTTLDNVIAGLGTNEKEKEVIRKAKKQVGEWNAEFTKDHENCVKLATAIGQPTTGCKSLLGSPHALAQKLTNYFNAMWSDKKLTEVVDSLNVIYEKTLPAARDGFTLEVNMAGSGVLQENKFKQSAPGKFAIWFVPSYRFNILNPDKGINATVDLLGVARVTLNGNKSDSLMMDSVNYYDLGIKAAAQYKKFALSFEAIFRGNFKAKGVNASEELMKKQTWRLVASIDYKINDFLGVQMSFGRDFDGKAVNFDEAKPNSLFYSAGLNVGLAIKDKKQ